MRHRQLIALALSVGSATLYAAGLAAFLVRPLRGVDPLAHEILLALRLPRAVNAFCTGGMLAMAGVLMQVLLRNPLADPYVLGISGGAAVAAIAAILFGFAGWLIDSFAAGGRIGRDAAGIRTGTRPRWMDAAALAPHGGRRRRGLRRVGEPHVGAGR